MKIATFKLVGTAPLLYSRPVFEKKGPDETHEQLEDRTWKKRADVDDDGNLCISASMIHKSLIFSGAWLSEKLSGNKTMTKRFVSGVVCMDGSFPVCNGTKKPLKLAAAEKYSLFVPSDGKSGGTKRVLKHFPRIHSGWSISGRLMIVDQAIGEDTFERHLMTSGLYDGLGSMRAGRGGPNGRFRIDSLEFEETSL